MTCEQGLLRLLWGGGPKLECYGTASRYAKSFSAISKTKIVGFSDEFLKILTILDSRVCNQYQVADSVCIVNEPDKFFVYPFKVQNTR